VMAAVECMIVPFGTVLGVLTIIVLSRDKVKRLFGVPPQAAEPGAIRSRLTGIFAVNK